MLKGKLSVDPTYNPKPLAPLMKKDDQYVEVSWAEALGLEKIMINYNLYIYLHCKGVYIVKEVKLLINLTINGIKCQAEPGSTILQAAQKVGIKIPTLCYDERLAAHGACRICRG